MKGMLFETYTLCGENYTDVGADFHNRDSVCNETILLSKPNSL